MRFDKIVLTIIPVLLGCALPIPHKYEYKRIDFEKVTRLRVKNSSGFGSPGLVIFPYHGIKISAMIRPEYLQVGIHVSDGHTVRLKSHFVKLHDIKNKLTGTREVELLPSPLAEIGNPWWMIYPDPFGKEDYFDMLHGGSNFSQKAIIKSVCDKCYLLAALFDGNSIKEGSVKLPDISIDGTDYEGPLLYFKTCKTLEFDPTVIPLN